jgi:hypothetical protein
MNDGSCSVKGAGQKGTYFVVVTKQACQGSNNRPAEGKNTGGVNRRAVPSEYIDSAR